jgi:MFS family permease
MIARLLVPPGVAIEAVLPVLVGRALRAFADGFVAVLLPAYLLALGFGQIEVGYVSTATLAGSALATLVVCAVGHRWPPRRMLLFAALLMAVTGLSLAGISSFWPLLVVAFVGTLNPSSGDVSMFLPLEHARLAHAGSGDARTVLFARYSLIGSLSAAIGALAAGIPPWLTAWSGLPLIDSLRAMFVLYGLIGGSVWLLYRTLPTIDTQAAQPPAPLGPSRGIVLRLAALFSVDAFAGGLVVNSLLTLWLFERFGLSLAQAEHFSFGPACCQPYLSLPPLSWQARSDCSIRWSSRISRPTCASFLLRLPQASRSRWLCYLYAVRYRKWMCQRALPM